MFNEGERKSYFSLIRFDLIRGKYIIISVENLSDGEDVTPPSYKRLGITVVTTLDELI